MSNAWDFYITNVNNVTASFFIDLGIHDSVPDADRPWLLWSLVHFHHPRNDGLLDSGEAPILKQIQEALTKSVSELSGAELVGRVTTAGRREFYFYGHRPGRFEEAIAKAMKCFPNYKFDIGVKKDPQWSQYLNVLYPSPEEHQTMKNLHVVEVLKKEGDPLKIPRPVSHWANFSSPQDRNKFIAKAIDAGFKVTDTLTNDDQQAEHPCGVVLERIDHVDWNSINKVTLALFRLAQEVGGTYDGWETSIETDY